MDGGKAAGQQAPAFGGHLVPGERLALIVVDVVMAYLEPGCSLYDPMFEKALESTRRIVAAAREAHVPVIFTNVVYQPGGADGGLFYRKVPALQAFQRGSPLGNFPPSLQPLPTETVVSKQYASAFFGTSLASTLRTQQIDTVLITGFSTSGCIRATALDALQHGFAPFVIADACGDRHSGPHEANLFDLQTKYAEVVSEDRSLELLRNSR